MENVLKGKVAVITGAGRGIGSAIAKSYALQGCGLVLLSRSEKELKDTAQNIFNQTGSYPKIWVADVSDELQFRSIIESTKTQFGQIDILINNAGIIGPIGPIAEIDSNEWIKTIQINLNGIFYGIKSVLPYMQEQKQGRIINFSGGGALLPAPFFDAYSVTKAGVVRLTENLALELKGTGIMICAVSPAGVNTRMFEDMMKAGEKKVGTENWTSFQKRKEAGGDSIENIVDLSLFLATTKNTDVINGRVISAKWDKWKKFSDYSQEIISSDLFTMRRIIPQDRGYDW